MTQFGLDMPTQVHEFFTLEKFLMGLFLFKAEELIDYQEGRLKRGTEYYLLSAPINPVDFDIIGTKFFQSHKMKKASLLKSTNSADSNRNSEMDSASLSSLIKFYK